MTVKSKGTMMTSPQQKSSVSPPESHQKFLKMLSNSNVQRDTKSLAQHVTQHIILLAHNFICLLEQYSLKREFLIKF